MGAKRLYTHVRYAGDAGERTHRLLQTAAEEAYYVGNSAEAQLLYAQLFKQNPACRVLNQQMFAIYYEHGDFRRALKHLRRLLAHGMPPDEPDAWQSLCLGELLYQTGQILEAATYLDRAASMRLQDYKLFYYLGLCRLHDGAMREARRQFARAVQMLNPGICTIRLDEMLRVHQELSPRQSTPQKTS
jgi:predicted Zn-dependent protease